MSLFIYQRIATCLRSWLITFVRFCHTTAANIRNREERGDEGIAKGKNNKSQ